MKVIGANLLVLALLLLAMEVAFRALGYGYGNLTLNPDPDLHHVHPAGYSFRSYTPSKEYGGHEVFFDKKGNRAAAAVEGTGSGQPVWFLGDSFTEAAQVDWATSFVGRAGASMGPGLRAVNMGVSSYSPMLELLQLKKAFADSSEARPAMAFIQLYWNDPKDDGEYAASATFSDDGQPLRCDGGQPSRLTAFFRKSYVVRVFRRAQMTIQYILEQKKAAASPAENSGAPAGGLVTGNYLELAPAIADSSRFAKSTRQIDAFLKEKGVPHWFFAVPSKYACLTGDWESATFASNFGQWAAAQGLPFIDLNGAFREASATGGGPLFFDLDIHTNARGHALIADGILKTIAGQRQTAQMPPDASGQAAEPSSSAVNQ